MRLESFLLLGLVHLIAVLSTWAAIHYAQWRRLLDLPGERRSHKVSTPRGGGIAIAFSQLLACVIGVFLFPMATAALLVFAAGLLLVAGIGWWDDHRPLPALPRLGVHLVAAGLLGGLVWLATGSLPKALFCAGLAVSLINIWNFMDGINGLASTQAILVGGGAALLLPAPWSMAGWVLAAGCAGFLPFNFPRARIFMGDVGSGALGYLIAGLLALGMCVSDAVPMLWLMLPAAFCIDAGFTLLLRISKGEPWMQAHTQHLYQRFVKLGYSHAAVTCGYAAFSVVGITMAQFFSRLSPAWGWAGGLSWIAAGVAIRVLLQARTHS